MLKVLAEGDMNDKIHREACHNGTRAEYTKGDFADCVVTRAYQGDDYWICNGRADHRGR